MRDQALFDKIDLHLIRVLHTVLTERSVSRAAVRLGMHQPAVSAALKRLRDLAGDPLLVRSGASMMPTDAALRMVEPAALILRSAEALFSDARGFDPRTATRTFRVAASDYLDHLFLPQLVARNIGPMTLGTPPLSTGFPEVAPCPRVEVPGPDRDGIRSHPPGGRDASANRRRLAIRHPA